MAGLRESRTAGSAPPSAVWCFSDSPPCSSPLWSETGLQNEGHAGRTGSRTVLHVPAG